MKFVLASSLRKLRRHKLLIKCIILFLLITQVVTLNFLASRIGNITLFYGGHPTNLKSRETRKMNNAKVAETEENTLSEYSLGVKPYLLWENKKIGTDFYPNICDLDNDGFQEIVVYNTKASSLYVIDSVTGNIKWNITAKGNYFEAPLIGDIDGDNKLEVIIVANHSLYALNGEDMSRLWNQSFYGHLPLPPGYNFFDPIALVDVDNDSLLDVIIQVNWDYIYAIKGTNGEILWNASISLNFHTIAIGDVDNDKKPELVIGGSATAGRPGAITREGGICVLNSEDGSLLWRRLPGATYSVVLADVNNDGALEIIAGTISSVCVFNGKTGEKIWCYKSLYQFLSITVADVTGDGILDVIARADNLSFYFSVSNETFFVFNASNGNLYWSKTVSYNYKFFPTLHLQNIVIGDIDNDMRLDIIIPSRYGILVLNGKTGQIGVVYEHYIGSGCVTLADIDKDSRIELIVTATKGVFVLNFPEDRDSGIRIYWPTHGLTSLMWKNTKVIDEDNDGVSDYSERLIGTNPNNADSDNDGFSDGFELANGFDPSSALSNPKTHFYIFFGTAGIGTTVLLTTLTKQVIAFRKRKRRLLHKATKALFDSLNNKGFCNLHDVSAKYKISKRDLLYELQEQLGLEIVIIQDIVILKRRIPNLLDNIANFVLNTTVPINVKQTQISPLPADVQYELISQNQKYLWERYNLYLTITGVLRKGRPINIF